MLEQFYSKLSPRMNAAEHAGIRSKQGWTVQLELDCSLLSISLNKHLNTLKNIKNNWKKSSQTLPTLINNFYIQDGICVMTRMVVSKSLTPTISQRDESYW